MRLKTYFIIGAFCLIAFISFLIVSCSHIEMVEIQHLRLGKGLSFHDSSMIIAIPSDHPDFTRWPIVDYSSLTPEVSILRLAKPGQGCYELILCEYKPLVLALHYSCKGQDVYWIYMDIVPVPATKEEFEKRKAEGAYLCPQSKMKEV